MTTFKQMNQEKPLEKRIVKAGLSLAIIFSKEEIKRYGLSYGKSIKLDQAELIET